MTRREFAEALGSKLEKVRKMFHLSVTQMARTLNCSRLSYTRSARGTVIPNHFTLYNMGTQFDISLNWLILDEGPMSLKDITEVKKVQPAAPPLAEDIKELLDYMEKIPLLRHEILVHFHTFRENHPAMAEKASRT